MTQSQKDKLQPILLKIGELILIAVVVIVSMRTQISHIEQDVMKCQENKVNNDVLLEYIRAHERFHELEGKERDRNTDELKELRGVINQIRDDYISMRTRGTSNFIQPLLAYKSWQLNMGMSWNVKHINSNLKYTLL